MRGFYSSTSHDIGFCGGCCANAQLHARLLFPINSFALSLEKSQIFIRLILLPFRCNLFSEHVVATCAMTYSAKLQR